MGSRLLPPPDNITLNPANKRTGQSLLDFQIGIDTAAHTTLDTQHLISHAQSALADTIGSLQGSDGGVIGNSEVHELLTKIHDILDNAVSTWFGNAGHILAYLFNSASRQHC